MRKRVTAPGGLAGRILRILPALLLGSALTGSSLLAQARPADVAPTSNTFDLTVAAGEHYTTNAEFTPDPVTSQDRIPESDFYSDMRVNLAVSRRSNRTDWSLRYSPFYTRYRQNSQLDTSNHLFDYGGTYTMSRRWRVILAEHFTYSRDPLHVATVEGGYDPVLTAESKRWRSFSDVGTETDLSRTLTLQGGISGRLDRFQDPILTDSRTWSGRVGVLKHLGRNQSLTATYLYSRFLLSDHEDPVTHQDVGTPDVTSNDIELGWEHTVPGGHDFRVNGGAAEVIQEGERQKRFTGGLSYRQPFRHADLTAGFRQSLSADAGVASVNVSQNAYAGFSVRIGRITTLGLTGDYGTRKSALEQGEQVDLSYAGALLRGAVEVNERLSVLAEMSRRIQRDAFHSAGDVNVDAYFVGVIFKIF